MSNKQGPYSNRSKRQINNNNINAKPLTQTNINNCILKVYQNFLDLNIDLYLYNSSITEVPLADCIVNCTGPRFDHYNGISKAITEAAGNQIKQDYLSYLNNNRVLELFYVHTTDAYNLKNQRKILHVRSPMNLSRQSIFEKNRFIRETEKIYYNLLKKCFCDLNFLSLATPLIGTGLGGISLDECIVDLIGAIRSYSEDFKLKSNFNKLSVYIVNNDPSCLNQVVNLIENEIKKYLNPNNTQHLNIALPHHQQQQQQLSQSLNFNKFNANNQFKTPASNISTMKPIDLNSNNKQMHQTITNLEFDENLNDKNKQINEKCVICLDDITNVKILDKCGHKFCTECIDDYFEKSKKVCPVCNTVYGLNEGNQPDGVMTHRILNQALPGFPYNSKTIEINYNIPSGVQTSKHPNPGQRYHGTNRVAYLPDTPEGHRIFTLLRKAFDLKLVFTVGQSRTTGQNNVVTWNDIHHKTQMHGGPAQFGYPDPTYLDRVLQELADKGIS